MQPAWRTIRSSRACASCRAAFDKFGVRSRRELVAAILTGHH